MNIQRVESLLNYLNQLDNIKRHESTKKFEDEIDFKILAVCKEIEQSLAIQTNDA